MNKAEVGKLADQYLQYQREVRAKRRNLGLISIDYTSDSLTGANRLNEATMMIIRTEAKAKAVEEVAALLGVLPDFSRLIAPIAASVAEGQG